MPKFFVEQEQIKDEEITIIGEDVNHIKNVLRKKRNKFRIQHKNKHLARYTKSRQNGVGYTKISRTWSL